MGINTLNGWFANPHWVVRRVHSLVENTVAIFMGIVLPEKRMGDRPRSMSSPFLRNIHRHTYAHTIAILHPAAGTEERRLRHCIGAGIIVWFIISTVFSFDYHLASHVFIKTVSLVVVLLLLVTIRKHFKKGKQTPDEHFQPTQNASQLSADRHTKKGGVL